MRRSKTEKKKDAAKNAARAETDRDTETRALIREILNPYWASRFARS